MVYLSSGRTDELYNYILDHYPDVKEQNIQAYVAINQFDLLVTYKDGRRELFDTYDGFRQYIPYQTDALTEEQHRKTFPNILMKMIKRRGISQEDFANRLGLSQSMISKYLSGRALPGYTILKRMSEILNCDVDDLYLHF